MEYHTLNEKNKKKKQKKKNNDMTEPWMMDRLTSGPFEGTAGDEIWSERKKERKKKELKQGNENVVR
jgi:hypothetical protein